MSKFDYSPISGVNADSQKSPVSDHGGNTTVLSMSLEEAWKIVGKKRS